MKSKFEKVLSIILICLLVAIGIAVAVLYIIMPDVVKDGFEYVVDLLNKPLPIVGLTTSAVLIFLWQVIVRVRFGKGAIAKYDQKCQENTEMILEEKNNIKNEREENAKERKENREMINELRNQLVEVCKTSPNIKINELGERIAKETFGHEQEEVDNSSEKE